MRKINQAFILIIILFNFKCTTQKSVYKKNYVILDFKDCDDKEKEYNFIKIDIPKELKKSKVTNDAFCEYRFTCRDESVVYITSDVYRGSRLNFKNLYDIGVDGYYPRKTTLSDTIKNEGKDTQNLYWSEYILGDVVVGYSKVPEINKEKYDTIISSIKRLKKL
jgi:hypothetical protein